MEGDGLTYKGESMRFGMVTYQWGKDWDLPTLLTKCEAAKITGVELRTTHAHGVEPELDAAARQAVRRRFDASAVTCVGLGSDERFDNPDPEKVSAAIARTKAFVRLSHDIGGGGVKVKPDRFHEGVDRSETIDQIGRALAEVAEYGTGFGQEIRLEVHGGCSELTTIAAILKAADHPNAKVCWNSNKTDLAGAGLGANFALVKEALGETVHVRGLNGDAYPYGKLMDLLVDIDYPGWVLIEDGVVPLDVVSELAVQREAFAALLEQSRRRVK